MVVHLPETDLARVQRWCRQRIPERAQHQVRREHEGCGHDVILVERRVPWNAPDTQFGPHWTARPVARLRQSATGWRLYWADSNTRWHHVDDVPAATSVAPRCWKQSMTPAACSSENTPIPPRYFS